MKITLIRHFKTRSNQEHRYIGRTDEPLAPDQMIEKSYPPGDVLIVSPMKRCIQTAEIIYHGQPQIICAEFKECDFGLFEGKNYEELKGEPAYQEWLNSGGAIHFPAGESSADFKKRCVRGFRRMTKMLSDQNCKSAVMVVHGGTIMAILEQFDPEGRDFYHWQVENGSGYTTHWDSGRLQLLEIHTL